MYSQVQWEVSFSVLKFTFIICVSAYAPQKML